MKKRLRVYLRSGSIQVRLVGKKTVRIEIVVRAEQLAWGGLLQKRGEARIARLRGRGFPRAEVIGHVVTIHVIPLHQFVQFMNLRALGKRNTRVHLRRLVGCEMKIVGQAAPREMALFGDEMVATRGNDVALVFFRLAVITRDPAVGWVR